MSAVLSRDLTFSIFTTLLHPISDVMIANVDVLSASAVVLEDELLAALIPVVASLIQPIDGFVQSGHRLAIRVLSSFEKSYINSLLQVRVQKRRFDVE
eukprot:750347-Prorocentrum_minimum.AAC.1